MNSKIYIKSIT